MMCPSFLLLCPSLTSLHFHIRLPHEIQFLPHLSLSLLSSFSFFFSVSIFCSSSSLVCDSVINTSCVHMMNRTHRDFSPLNRFQNPKIRLRHHSLMQDYQELHMETEAMRKRLQTTRERKAKLIAEVNFLRRRYRHLKEDQTLDNTNVRGRSNGGNKIRVQVSPNKKTKHVSLPDLNQSGRVHDETKTSLTRKVPLFDLNQISGEEEEEETEEAVNNNNQESLMREEERSLSKRVSSIEMQQQKQKEMKLLSCRNGGNGSNKRKITWQDPVGALRV